MKKYFLLLIFISLSLITSSQNQQYSIIASNVTFEIKNAGFTVNGKLGNVTGVVEFDVNKNILNKIEASVDANTISTDNSMRDSHLKKKEYFYSDMYPKISMSTSTITKETNTKYKGLFILTIKGISKIVPIMFTISEFDEKIRFFSSFTIRRLDYNVGSTSFLLSNDVTVNVDVTCTKK